MKQFKYYLIILIIFIGNINNTFAEKIINDDVLYEKYKNNITNYCLNKNYYKPSTYIYKYKDKDYQKYYPKINDLIKKAGLNKNKIGVGFGIIKDKYKNIQNEIYKCGIILAQYKGINLISKEANIDKTGKLKGYIDTKYKPLLIKLKNRYKNCNLSNKDIKLTKKDILNQSSFELCKYSYYLDYLYQHYNTFENILGIKENDETLNNTKYNPNYIVSVHEKLQNQIKLEKKHSYKILPIAFTAYSEYQNYYPIHLSLELLKINLISYRENLYKVLNPINQVVYKIINAMSK